MSEIITLYKDAIKVCKTWRKDKFNLNKATPNEIHLYNIFSAAQHSLEQQLACIEDAMGIYMKGKK